MRLQAATAALGLAVALGTAMDASAEGNAERGWLNLSTINHCA